MANETGTRILVAAVGIPIVVGLIYLGGWPLAVLLAAAAVLAVREFYSMAERKGARPLRLLGCVVAAAFVALAALAPAAGPERVGFGTLVTLAVLATSALAIWARGVEGEPLLSISTTVMGAVYTGAILSFALFLRHLPETVGARHGTALVLAPVVLTWTSDTFAYFVGRAWGTRKLIPKVSPGKTVQGAVGAVVGSMLVALAYAQILDRFPTYRLSALEALLFGLIISVTAQLGDLVESLLKRDAGVKDSGTLLPGHGGALDRFDSLLFTLPVAYFLFRLMVLRAGGIG
jgi:phosphatidate cytidylyltransferase